MSLRLLLTAALAASLTAQTPQPAVPTSPLPDAVPDQKPASVSGKTANAGGQALKKTTLTLRPVLQGGTSGQPSSSPYVTTSDADGNFVFEEVDPGRYTLLADHPGYLRQTYGARKGGVAGSGTVLTLTSGKVMSALNITMHPQVVISGKVLDSDGDPAGRVQVRAARMTFFAGKRQLAPSGNAMTDENGDYKIQNLPPGKYYVSAAPQGNMFFGENYRSAAAAGKSPAKQEEALVRTFYPGVTEIGSAQAIELVAGHDRLGTNITLRMAPVFHIRGKIAGVLPGNRAEFRVMLTPRSTPQFDFMGNSSSAIGKDGSFDLANCSAGAYNVVITNMGGVFKTVGSMPVDVADRNVDDLQIAAQPTFDLAGQVTTEPDQEGARTEEPKKNQQPLPTRVSLQPLEGPLINSPFATASEDGSLTLSSVSPGRYRVSVYSLEDGKYVKSIRYGDQDALRNGLDIAQGGGSTPLQITLSTRAAKLEGTVQDAQGKSSASTVVTLIPDPANPDRPDLYRQGNTDQNGAFSIRNIPPGKYKAYAWDDLENGNQYDPEFMKNYETKGGAVELAPSGTGQITLTSIK